MSDYHVTYHCDRCKKNVPEHEVGVVKGDLIHKMDQQPGYYAGCGGNVDVLKLPVRNKAEIVEDLLSHREVWHKALQIARNCALTIPPDIDDRAYWAREIKRFNEIMDLVPTLLS